MDRTEHLLACLAEEAAEVGMAVGKALRFGLDDGRTQDTTNADDIARELNELFAVAEMLEECGALPKRGLLQDIGVKRERVAKWMEYAEQRGTLVPNGSGKPTTEAAKPL